MAKGPLLEPDIGVSGNGGGLQAGVEVKKQENRGCKFFCVFGDRILMIKIRYVVLFVKLFDKNAVEYVF